MGKSAVVAGAGGFIGHHLVKFLKAEGYRVRGVDVKLPAYEQTCADEFEQLDLRVWADCLRATREINEVYQLAADMGGMGYTSTHPAGIAPTDVLITASLLRAALHERDSHLTFSSSS